MAVIKDSFSVYVAVTSVARQALIWIIGFRHGDLSHMLVDLNYQGEPIMKLAKVLATILVAVTVGGAGVVTLPSEAAQAKSTLKAFPKSMRRISLLF